MTSSFYRLGLTASAMALMALTTACAQEKSADTTNSDIAEQSSDAEMTPISAGEPSGHAHGADGHDHDDHDAGPAMPVDIDHVFTRAPDDHVVGDAMAPNTLIVYASVTCPHCAAWFTSEWPKFKADQIDTGKTLMIFREIPTPPQEIAVYGFVLANCAPEDKYMDHIVYQMQNQESIFEKLQAGDGKEVYDGLAARAELTTPEQIDTCFNDKEHLDLINRSSQRMTGAGASAVPSFILNGELFTGDSTADGLKAALEP